MSNLFKHCNIFPALVVAYSLMFIIVYAFKVGFISPLIPILGFVFYILLIYRPNIHNNSFVRKIICFIGGYTIFTLIYVVKFDFQTIVWYCSDKYLLLPYLCVFLGIKQFDITIIKRIPQTLFLTTLFFLGILFVFKDQILVNDYNAMKEAFTDNQLSLDTISKEFCFCSGFLLFCSPFSRKWKIYVVWCAFFICFLLSLFMARRNLIATILLFFVFFIIGKIRSKQSNIFTKCVAFIVLVFSSILIFNIAKGVMNGSSSIALLENLSLRMSNFDSDGRFNVQNFLLNDLNENPLRWIFGKGINGSYYCPGFTESGYRNIIETGFLQIVLRIGLLGLLSYLIVVIYTVKNSINGNVFIRSASYYIIIYSIQTVYAGVPAFDLGWVLFWILISICNNRKFRDLTDNEIKQILCQ